MHGVIAPASTTCPSLFVGACSADEPSLSESDTNSRLNMLVNLP